MRNMRPSSRKPMIAPVADQPAMNWSAPYRRRVRSISARDCSELVSVCWAYLGTDGRLDAASTQRAVGMARVVEQHTELVAAGAATVPESAVPRVVDERDGQAAGDRWLSHAGCALVEAC